MKIQDKPYQPNQYQPLFNSMSRTDTSSAKPLQPETVPLELHTESYSLREQILAIQQAKAKLGIENLAASEFDFQLPSDRRRIARNLTKDPSWYNFQKVRQQLVKERTRPFGNSSTLEVFVSVMLEIVSKLNPGMIGAPNAYEVQFGQFSPFSNSVLMKISRGEYRDLHTSFGARENSAKILRTIVEKIGDRLDDEATIIRLLLTSPDSPVRKQGAITALNTYKHKWRKGIKSTGFLSALRKEQNDEIRVQVAKAIALAAPQSFLEEHNLDKHSSLFMPLRRLVSSDECYVVKHAILSGVTNVCLAQQGKGKYYEDFREIPQLSIKNRIDCISHTLTILENLCRINPRTVDELHLIPISLCILAKMTSDQSIEIINASEQSRVYRALDTKITNLDIEKLTILSTKHSDRNSPVLVAIGTASLDTRENICALVDRILVNRTKSNPTPLLHFFEQKRNLSKLKDQTEDRKAALRIEDVIQRINNAIKDYLIHTEVKQIIWGDYTDFNLIVSDLSDLLLETKDNNCRLAILSLFKALHSDGVQLEKYEPLEKALNKDNETKLRDTLRVVIHSGKVFPEFFSDTQPAQSTSLVRTVLNAFKVLAVAVTANHEQYALDLYRVITRSYKDYFGMTDLKQRMIKTASQCLQSNSPAGILLSGTPGAGKSLLAEVLANEIALPLRMLIPREIGKRENGQAIIRKEGKEYTFEEYFESLKRGGSCVFLVDEIDEIFSPKEKDETVAFLKFFKDLEDLKIPIIVIATTNRPILDNLHGVAIDSNGSSNEMSRLMAQDVNPNLFAVLQPCYIFHTKSVGYDFAQEYINHLIGNEQVKGSSEEPEFKKACAYARGITPYAIEQCTAGISNPTVKTIMNELKVVKLNSTEICETARIIEIIVERLVMDLEREIQGHIDYKELALVAEDIPPKTLVEIISNSPSKFEQDDLIKLLAEYRVN